MSIKRISNNRATRRNMSTDKFPSRKGLLNINQFNTAQIGEWQDYTPTFTGVGTPTNTFGKWRRVGDSMQVVASCVNSTVTAALGSVSLPSGYFIDSSKLTISTTTGQSSPIVGMAAQQAAGAARNVNLLAATGTSSSVVYMSGNIAISNALLPQNASTVWDSANNLISWNFIVPIQGWASKDSQTIEEIIESSFFDLENINGQIQVASTTTGISGISDNVETDIPGLLLTVNPGTYFLEVESSCVITFSVAPTWIGFDLIVRDENDNLIALSEQAGIARRGSITFGGRETLGQIITITNPITINVSGRIEVSGGTITSRDIKRSHIKLTKISN